MSDPVVIIISCQGLFAHKELLYLEFQFTAIDFVSNAAKTSDRGDNLTEANLQTDSLEERPAQRAVDHHKMEEEDSSPHNSLMWSPVPRLPKAISI